MKQSRPLKEKFRPNSIKPLYRKARLNKISVIVDNIYKLDGQDFRVQREIATDLRNTNEALPGTCEANNLKTVLNKVYKVRNDKPKEVKMINAGNFTIGQGNRNLDKNIQAEELAVPRKVGESWLRVYPLPELSDESVCSTVFRCVVCQLGLATVLVLWTVVWMFVIHSFEGPYELKVSQDFESEQNQLVIDLATELRQITPISPKWREAIERRIQDERQLTILAVGRGARPHPGQFWDLPGTFLFTVNVMTALGFGAPVPQTMWGRSAALVYAFIAIPTHIYLMVNASTCLVSRSRCSLLKQSRINRSLEMDNSAGIKESPNCSRNSEVLKASRCNNIRKKIMRCVCACRCVCVAGVLYWASGAVAFGALRGKRAVECLMFPLEFTTTGGLEQVASHVRVLYGLYVECAMALVACALAMLRARTNPAVNTFATKYRLFQVHV